MAAINGGFLFDDLGSLETSSEAIAAWNNGFPFDVAGKLVITTDSPASTDTYTCGIRVSPTKGVYVIVNNPVALPGFNSGFDTGFGAF